MKAQDLLKSHGRGMRFLFARRYYERDRDASWLALATIDHDNAARKLRNQLADELRMSPDELLKDIHFAAAVETIADNCGEHARKLLLGTTSQSRTSIMRLSRTADTRQRYRVEGVRSGHFRSVAPQKNDSVYDTVSFSEVSSRLRRGRGTLRELREALEIALLASPCGMATVVIKSVWDYPEMRNRGILPTDAERQGAIREANEIIGIARAIDEALSTLDQQR